METITINTYQTEDGKEPFTIWLNSLDFSVKARIDARLARVRKGNFGDSKSLSNELHELRFNFGAGYRIYYAKENNKVILLLSGSDKGNQSKIIKKAKSYYKYYKENKGGIMNQAVPYKNRLLEDLKKPKYAMAYLRATWQDEDIDVFMLALRDVVEAFGGVGKLANKIDMSRTTLYKILSKKGNPTISTLKKF